MKHIINQLSFGKLDEIQKIRDYYGVWMTDELKNTKVDRNTMAFGQLYVEYILDITEAEYVNYDFAADEYGERDTQSGYEYRSMKTIMTANGMGALWFKY